MIIRLGYVAIALNLKNVTSSSTVTFATYNKLKSEEERLKKLKSVTFSNTDDLETILKYNMENNIHFYRLTSKLIPLSTHPDQFNVINSVKDKVIEDTIRNLNHAVDLYDLMEYDEGKLVIHVGSSAGGKEESIKRFITNLDRFPKRITSRLIIENDDKVFTAKNVLDLCQEINCPMVLDLHHHKCKNDGEDIADLLEDIFNTWNNESLPPKVHFSSPRESEFDRKHADFIDVNDFANFLNIAKETTNKDFDVMIEAKKKDQALLKLVKDLKKINYPCEFLDSSTIKI